MIALNSPIEPTIAPRVSRKSAQRHPLLWWEDAPRTLPEKRLSPLERARRAQRWYRRHARTEVVCCSAAWRPIPLHLGDYEIPNGE
jgi:hypothetical protein